MSYLTDWLEANYGVSSPDQLRYRDASAGLGDMSRADLADAGYSSSRFGRPSAGLSGYNTPNGGYLAAGDVLRDGHTVYTIQQSADGKPAFSSHVDTPDLNLKDLAIMALMTVGGAYGMNALGGLMGAGGAAAEGLGAGAANGMWDVLPEAVGSGGGGMAGGANGMWDFLPEAMGGAPNTAVMGAGAADGAGAANGMWDVLPEAAQGGANGMWDVLPEAAGNGAANGSWDFLPPEANGLPPPVTPPGGMPNVPPVPPVSPGGSGDPTSYDYTNEMDKISDTATQTGVAPPGTINAGVPTNGGQNIYPSTGTPGAPGSGTTTPSTSSTIPDWAKALGIGLGALAGSQGANGSQTTTRDLPPELKPYIYGDATHHGLMPYTQQTLDMMMQPGFLQGYGDMRTTGQHLMTTPQRGNGFNMFYPGFAQAPAGAAGGWLSPPPVPLPGIAPQPGAARPFMQPPPGTNPMSVMY
jgi:hypothetical protein